MAQHATAKRVPLIIVGLLVLGALGWWAWSTWGPSADGGSGEVISASGSVEAEQSQVSSVIAGRIESSTATEGAGVKRGDELYQLDDRILVLQVDQAKAGLRAAKSALQQAKDDDVSDAEVDAARAKVDQASAAVEMAETQLSFATIAAPADGVISAVAARPGENASPGRALATITDLSSLYVTVYIPETQIGAIKLGDAATMTTDSSEREFTGTVTFIASEAEFTPSNIETKDQRVKLVYEVRIAAEDSGSVLKPGMPVDVVFE